MLHGGPTDLYGEPDWNEVWKAQMEAHRTSEAPWQDLPFSSFPRAVRSFPAAAWERGPAAGRGDAAIPGCRRSLRAGNTGICADALSARIWCD